MGLGRGAKDGDLEPLLRRTGRAWLSELTSQPASQRLGGVSSLSGPSHTRLPEISQGAPASLP